MSFDSTSTSTRKMRSFGGDYKFELEPEMCLEYNSGYIMVELSCDMTYEFSANGYSGKRLSSLYNDVMSIKRDDNPSTRN